MTDPIADMLTRMRNALRVKKSEVFVPFSKLKLAIVKILKQEGYIEGFEEIKPGSEDQRFGGIMIQLKYDEERQPTITVLKRISKPGIRRYVSNEELPKVLNGFGIAIISNSQGVMTNKKARQLGLGGEVLCEIY